MKENEPMDEEKPFVRFEQTGIAERYGHVPLWFIVLMVVLLAWGIYYLAEHWGGLGPGIGY